MASSSDESAHSTHVMDNPSPEFPDIILTEPGPVSPSMSLGDETQILFSQDLTQTLTIEPPPSQQSTQRKRSNKDPIPAKVASKKKTKERNDNFPIDPTDFATEDVIQYVQERPSLWDKSHRKHHDNTCTRRKWEEIYVKLFPDFASYSEKLQDTIAELVEKRWRSVRDSFFKWVRESNLPSGSGAKKTTYKHAKRLSFLTKVQELRATSTNTGCLPTPAEPTAQPEAILDEENPQPAQGGSQHQPPTVTSSLRSSIRHSSKKGRDNPMSQCMLDGIDKLENICTSKFLHLDVRVLRLEGMIGGPPPQAPQGIS
ncbi:uncharacterized protein LOC120941182 [Rana temporaria]|uniref:uncharacterized protein LOC120941182 n=1 Tax=Rana temporaria TaxID=8407 RepID=UPI001AACB673|nr:uncharacterized protein LOC120941182 [Rana temporaria]